MIGVGDAGQAKVADLQLAVGVQQNVARLQVAVEDIRRVDVLEAAQYLVEEVADVVVAELLSVEQLRQVGLHQRLDDVDVAHSLDGRRADDVDDVDDVLVAEAGENLDLPQRSLAVRLVLEGGDLLEGDALVVGAGVVRRRDDHAVGALANVHQVAVAGAHLEALAANGLHEDVRQDDARVGRRQWNGHSMVRSH